jgi:Family of unknown function (DUF6152)
MRISMIKRALLATAAAGLALTLPGSGWAHHAFSMYDYAKYVPITGTVKTYKWANPHTMIDFVVKGPDGKVAGWTAECSPINMIGRRGWTSDSLKVGDKVDFVIHPNKSGANYGLLVSVTKADGTVLKDKD